MTDETRKFLRGLLVFVGLAAGVVLLLPAGPAGAIVYLMFAVVCYFSFATRGRR